MIVYRCEDTLESIFTAVYLAYEEKRDLQDTYLNLTGDPMLFAPDVPVVTDREKAGKVARTFHCSSLTWVAPMPQSSSMG